MLRDFWIVFQAKENVCSRQRCVVKKAHVLFKVARVKNRVVRNVVWSLRFQMTTSIKQLNIQV